MQIVSLTKAENNFKDIFNSVYHDSEEVIIHNEENKNIVIIPMDEYNSLKETNYLLSSPKNREVLLRSLNDARNGKVVEKELLKI